MRSLPIIATFLFLIFLSSCGDATKNSEKSNSETVETKDAEKNTKTKVILFFGNSLTAGYGLEDGEKGFPELIQQKIDSIGFDYKVINAGLSGETTSGGKGRIDWILKQKVAVFVLELGGNDGLRGIPIDETYQNLQDIINTVENKNPETKIVLAGMQIPPNMGQDYTLKFKNIFSRLAEKNDVKLIPFLLKDVGGIPELNQSDGIHPTAEGQKIVAANVWEIIKPLLKEE